MKKMISITSLIYLLFCSHGNAEVVDSSRVKNMQLPSGAFWIKNYSKNSDVQVTPPINWRSAERTNLLLSGSAIPTLNNMIWIKKTYGKTSPVYILDLRQETHLYLDGLPVSIFYKRDEINWGKNREEINQEEENWIDYLLNTGFLLINKLGPPCNGCKVPIEPSIMAYKESYSEKEAALRAGLGYFRINVPDYHPPAPNQVDEFLAILNQIPENSWLHIHCAAGKGRTTTFMVMRDIVMNGSHNSLEDILVRQKELGGIDLEAPSPSHSSQPWKKAYHHARKYYIRLFYHYINSGAYPNETFSSWIKKQPDNPYSVLLKTEAYKGIELQTFLKSPSGSRHEST